MLDHVFLLPAWAQLLVCAAYGLVLFAASAGVLQLLHRRHLRNARLLPVGPAFQIVTVLFALLLGFLAADLWAQQRQAVDAAFKEALAFNRLTVLAESAAPQQPTAAALLEDYRVAVADAEWGRDANQVADSRATAALKAMRVMGVADAGMGGMRPALAAEWMRATGELQEARDRRLLIGTDTTDNSQWTLVLMLAFFAAVALAVCHMDRPPAGRLILAVFALALTLVFWQLARHTNPYAGGDLRIPVPLALKS